MTVTKLNELMGTNSLIFVFSGSTAKKSTNFSFRPSFEIVEKTYSGDFFVDIIGLDEY